MACSDREPTLTSRRWSRAPCTVIVRDSAGRGVADARIEPRGAADHMLSLSRRDAMGRAALLWRDGAHPWAPAERRVGHESLSQRIDGTRTGPIELVLGATKSSPSSVCSTERRAGITLVREGAFASADSWPGVTVRVGAYVERQTLRTSGLPAPARIDVAMGAPRHLFDRCGRIGIPPLGGARGASDRGRASCARTVVPSAPGA